MTTSREWTPEERVNVRCTSHPDRALSHADRGKAIRPDASIRLHPAPTNGLYALEHEAATTTDRQVARPTGFEPVTLGFGNQYSIQLSYGRVEREL